MEARLVKIGNSRGIRIPRAILEQYQWQEGTNLELETRQEGLFIRLSASQTGKVSFETAYAQQVEEIAERQEWSEWDSVSGDGWGD